MLERARREPLLVLCEKPLAAPECPGECRRMVEATADLAGIVLYDFPIPDDQEHSAHIAELLELQAEVISKYIIKVEAPKMNGKHDDFADALVRMVWVATQNSGRVHSVRGVRSRRGYGLASASTTRFARKPHRTRSGSHPSRMTKTKIRR